MKKKKDKKYEEVSYWETMADSLIALLLCILLIALLLVLYLVRMPEEHIEEETPENTEQYAHNNDNIGDYTNEYIQPTTAKADDDHSDGGGAWGGGGSDGQGGNQDGDKDNDYPKPGTTDGEGYGKAAVYVEIVDGETNRTIKYENVEFELYDDKNNLQVLSTYYPEKIDYKKFVTDEAGTFYLPEKVVVQEYYLHALTRVPGYDYAEDTKLEISDGYEWNEPYTAKVVMYPEKNVIRLRLKDESTGKSITGATFDIIAATDITTKDGTIRCKEGDVVDTIELDKDGYGQSTELYLGEYLVQQSKVPMFYAKILEDTKVTVESKAKTTEVKETELREGKTKIKITLSDELNPATYIEKAKFTLTSEDGKAISTDITGPNGKVTFTDLEKDKTYIVHQNTTAEGYRITGKEIEFTVDVDGLISGQAEYMVDASTRKIRIAIGIQDMIFRGQVSDVNIGLCDANGDIVKTWNSQAIEQTVESLEPGEYLVIIAGNESAAKRITVEDTAELQNFQFSRLTTTDIGVILAASLVFIALIIGLIAFLIHRARVKAEKKLEEENKNVDLEAK